MRIGDRDVRDVDMRGPWGTGQCLNVREGPGLNQKAVDCLPDGARIRIATGPAMGDDIQWWQVQGRSGWVAADFLRYPDAAQ